MFWIRPVMGVSISTRNVSFHDRLIIREIIPIVLINVLSITLTFRHTVLPVRLVSLDNLDVISPSCENKNCLILFCCYILYYLSLHVWQEWILICLPVFMISKNPISCLVKALNNFTLILHVNELMAQSKMPPLQPALTELQSQWK